MLKFLAKCRVMSFLTLKNIWIRFIILKIMIISFSASTNNSYKKSEKYSELIPHSLIHEVLHNT